jgi:hypothetical protein
MGTQRKNWRFEKVVGDMRMVEIYTARFPEHLGVVRAIFREYAESLLIDLSFQDFESELADLPGKFAPPVVAFLSLRAMGKLLAA